MSKDYEKLAAKWRAHYITEDSLRQWVVINSKKPSLGITAEEFKEITGIDY